MRFFDRFRTALSRYEEGVHDLAEPATKAALVEAETTLGRPLPSELREFFLQWNGGYLFHDDIALFGVSGARPELACLSLEAGRIALGTTSSSRLFVDERGRVRSLDEETDELRIEGSGFERWLDATMAREGVLYDRDGEFRDEAFDGEGVSAKARRKRAQAGIKADPDSPAWHEELAELLLEEGETARAVAELQRAVVGGDEEDAALAAVWLSLGRLKHAADEPSAVYDFVRAARSSPDAGEAAYAYAQAARAARKHAPEHADGLAAEAARLAPAFVAEQQTAAAHLVQEGDLDGAIERIELALAISPADPALEQLRAQTRARRSLRAT